jgi:F-type H+-transporting ATPase subunit c
MGNMPFAVVPGAHPFTVTSQFTITGVMSLISFAIVLGVGAAGIGVGIVFGSFLESALRNPAAADGQQGRLFIGFAAAELLGLMAFAISMIILYAI